MHMLLKHVLQVKAAHTDLPEHRTKHQDDAANGRKKGIRKGWCMQGCSGHPSQSRGIQVCIPQLQAGTFPLSPCHRALDDQGWEEYSRAASAPAAKEPGDSV